MQISSENSTHLWRLRSRRRDREGGATGHKEIYFWELTVIKVSCFINMALYYKMWQILRNATTVLLPKCDKSLMQNGPGVWLQKATVLLQNASAQSGVLSLGVRVFCQGPLSTSIQFVHFLFDVPLLCYNPEFFQKRYFVFSCSNLPEHRT